MPPCVYVTAYLKSPTKTYVPTDAAIEPPNLAAATAAAHDIFRASPALHESIYPDPNNKPTSPPKNAAADFESIDVAATFVAARDMFRASPALDESI